jgi:hypothetical protein
MILCGEAKEKKLYIQPMAMAIPESGGHGTTMM